MEDPCLSDTDEQTVAFRKKRSRRVSFADQEITSVHFFNRDEDYETPPNSSSSSPNKKKQASSSSENKLLGLFKDLAPDSDDSKVIEGGGGGGGGDESENEIVDARRSFFRPIESPSPGSSIIGSATSNDEENFFGPVSASFIRPGRPSDSGASDENHDVTMDSTVFSMHYRSLARSESGGELKTPTNIQIGYRENTPPNVSTPADSGSFMVLTKAKTLLAEHTVPAEKSSGSRDSNDMSLVGESLRSYDYGKLSPGLEAILAIGSKDLDDISDITISKIQRRNEVIVRDESGVGHEDQIVHRKERDDAGEGASATCTELDAVNGSYLRNRHFTADIPVKQEIQTSTQLSKLWSPNRLSKVQSPHHVNSMLSPNQLSKAQSPHRVNNVLSPHHFINESNDHSKAVTEMGTLGPNLTPHRSWTSTNGEVLNFNLSTQHETGGNSSEVCWKENSTTERTNAFHADQNAHQQHVSPIVGSVSSLSAKSQLMLLDAPNFGRQLLCATPPPKQQGTLLGIKNSEIASSVHKHISRLKMFEPSPLANSLKDGIEKSKLRLSKLRSPETSLLSSAVEANRKFVEGKQVDAPITDLGKQMFSVVVDDKAHDAANFLESDGTGSLLKEERTLCLVRGVESLTPKKNTSQLITEVAPPSPCPVSQKEAMQSILTHAKSTGREVLGTEFDSPSVGIKVEHRNDMTTNLTLDMFVSSPGYQAKDTVQLNLLAQDKNSYFNSDNQPTAIADKLESRFMETRAQSAAPPLQNNHVEDLAQVEKSIGSQMCHSNQHHESETSVTCQTSLMERDALTSASGNTNRDILLTSGPTKCGEELAKRDKSSPSVSNTRVGNEMSPRKSPFRRDLTESSTREELTQSYSKKMQCNASEYGKLQFLDERVIFTDPSSTRQDSDENHLGLHKFQPSCQFPEQDVDNSSGRKRRVEEAIIGDADCADKVSRNKWSPNVSISQSSGPRFISDLVSTLQISLKFSAHTKQLFSPEINKHNIAGIDMLQDILVHLQKVKMYEMLCSQIQSQILSDDSSKDKNKRVAETRSLLHKLIFEQARAQLMSIKHEKFLKRSQQLSCLIQESQMLKSKSMCHLPFSDKRYTPVGDSLKNLCISNSGSKREVYSDKVVTMEREFEVLERKIKGLTQHLHSYCKIKGEPSCFETIAMLNAHLKKRLSCRLIHKVLQLWHFDEFGNYNDQQCVVLNYQGFVDQRFMFNSTPIHGISVSTKLNDMHINNSFPNMDVCKAFAFVLKVEIVKKYIDFRSLARETQITSSVLQNLVDVVEEIQRAQIEIRNLVQTSFHLPSVERLDLELCFVDFNSCRKVAVTLDLTCLNRGVYPSNVTPCSLQSTIAGTNELLPKTMLAQIKAEVGNLAAGYSRIIRLCRCISQVVQSSST